MYINPASFTYSQSLILISSQENIDIGQQLDELTDIGVKPKAKAGSRNHVCFCLLPSKFLDEKVSSGCNRTPPLLYTLHDRIMVFFAFWAFILYFLPFTTLCLSDQPFLIAPSKSPRKEADRHLSNRAYFYCGKNRIEELEKTFVCMQLHKYVT